VNEPAAPRAAATVVLLRPGRGGLEVLLTQRPATMVFAADMHVFPGGALDAGDADPRVAARSRPASDAEEAAARAAGVRELFEEAGVLLADARGAPPSADRVTEARVGLLDGSATIADVAETLDVDLRTDVLAPLSRWVTPPFVDRRFDVRFFAAELPAGAIPSFVGDEVVAHRWMTPRAALDERAAGTIRLWVPTSATLQQLEHVRSFDQIRERLGPRRAEGIRVLEEMPGVVRVVLPGAGGVEGQTVNAYLVGLGDVVVVDPGDPSDAAAERLLELARARGATISGVVLTHPDPDHAAGAEALAGRIGVPIFAGPGAGHDLPHDVVELADGGRMPIGDIELRMMTTPGHRADHIALAAEEFVLVGDLVGPGPSRSILGPPDADAWRASLDRLAALGPRRLLPGHGDPPRDAARAITDARPA
jgi:glyoxylase-like metal-dependent hydrolase (beta-lactamase superfamily II)/8-oxo-dGTP pyrophosphatase MutT (NUDIX family)